MISLFLIAVAVVVVMIFWIQSLRILKPLIEKGAHDELYIRENEILQGAKSLQLFMGTALVIILWQAFNNNFTFPEYFEDTVTILALLLLMVVAIQSYFHFKKASEIQEKVNKIEKNHSPTNKIGPYDFWIVPTLSSMTITTLANMAKINKTSNHLPAGVSASKMTS